MTKISSSMTFFHKRVFPCLWFGILGVFLVLEIVALAADDNPLPGPFVVVPLVMGVFGYGLMRALCFDLVDEVWDCGDSLLVRNGAVEEEIPLKDFSNLSFSPLINPPRAVMRLRRDSAFGREIAFCAPVVWIPFKTPQIIYDLIDRIDAARAA